MMSANHPGENSPSPSTHSGGGIDLNRTNDLDDDNCPTATPLQQIPPQILPQMPQPPLMQAPPQQTNQPTQALPESQDQDTDVRENDQVRFPIHRYEPPNEPYWDLIRDRATMPERAGQEPQKAYCPFCFQRKLTHDWQHCTKRCGFCNTNTHPGRPCPRIYASIRFCWRAFGVREHAIPDDVQIRPTNETEAQYLRDRGVRLPVNMPFPPQESNRQDRPTIAPRTGGRGGQHQTRYPASSFSGSTRKRDDAEYTELLSKNRKLERENERLEDTSDRLQHRIIAHENTIDSLRSSLATQRMTHESTVESLRSSMATQRETVADLRAQLLRYQTEQRPQASAAQAPLEPPALPRSSLRLTRPPETEYDLPMRPTLGLRRTRPGYAPLRPGLPPSQAYAPPDPSLVQYQEQDYEEPDFREHNYNQDNRDVSLAYPPPPELGRPRNERSTALRPSLFDHFADDRNVSRALAPIGRLRYAQGVSRTNLPLPEFALPRHERDVSRANPPPPELSGLQNNREAIYLHEESLDERTLAQVREVAFHPTGQGLSGSCYSPQPRDGRGRGGWSRPRGGR